MEEINFSLVNGHYESDAIIAGKDNMVIHLKFQKSGLTMVDRSIDGTDWYRDGALVTSGYTHRTNFETTICGVTEGQQIKLIFGEGVIPTNIQIL